MITKTHDKLKKFLGKKRTVQITVGPGETEEYSGYVIGLSKTLLVLLEYNDYVYEGYKILGINSIENIRRNEYDTTHDRILNFHSLDRDPISPKWLKFGSWPSVCKSLIARGQCISLQTFGEREWFSVGLIQDVKKDHISIREFDATAKWEEDLLQVGFSEIRYISFDSNYVNVFYEYMKSLE